MACCEWIDYSERPGSIIELYEFAAVTPETLAK